MEKSADAYRTISEVADDLGLQQHVLRFWETRFTQIRPLKRGGGRRYYRPDDVALIAGLKQLLHGRGYTIKGVQRILKEEGPRSVQAIGRGDPVPLPPPAATDPPSAEPVPLLEAKRSDVPTLLRGAIAELGECRARLAQVMTRQAGDV